ncbi:MAG: DUF86 domain-containing protein [bacterium]
MIDKQLVKNKLNDLRKYYEKLEAVLKEDARIIIEDDLKLYSTERLFQLIVDTAVDINTHIISESNAQVPEDYQSTFITLGENKILPMNFALKIAPSVGLRNLIIHKYGKVDLKRMIDDIKNEISDYLEYMKFVNNFLKK